MTTITITPEYGYVAGAILSTFYVNIWQMTRVGKARKAAGIPYPQVYAEKAEAAASKEAMIFNCAQRAHANTLETLPIVLASTVIASVQYPVPAAAALGVWSVFRVLYTIGYCTGDPRKRNYMQASELGSLTAVVLLLTATYTSAKLALGW